jgi:hypothetical protein
MNYRKTALHFTGKLLMPLAVAVLLALPAHSHQPRLVESSRITVVDPEISKAYYGQLSGEPHIYRIESHEPFALYVNILVPDIPGQAKDVSAVITRAGGSPAVLANFSADTSVWKRYWEEFGRDWYWMGPEYRARVDAGIYEIRVDSARRNSKYTLAVGEREAFDYHEGMNALRLIPTLKREFFGTSPAGFLLSPFGYGYVLSIYAIVFIAGYLLLWLVRRLANSGSTGRTAPRRTRVLRALVAVGLLTLAVSTSWNGVLLFLSALVLFTATSGWPDRSRGN